MSASDEKGLELQETAAPAAAPAPAPTPAPTPAPAAVADAPREEHAAPVSGDKPQWAKMPIPEALAKLESTEAGLTEAEVQKRLAQFGPNSLPVTERNAFLLFLSFMWNPLSWAMEVAAIIAICLVDYPDFALICGLLLLNAVIGFFEEQSAGNAVAALMGQLAPQAKVKRDGEWKNLPAIDLVPGDIIRIRLGDVVPADVKLLDGDEVKIDQSSLTGESLPATKYAGSEAYSGSIVKQGEIEAVVHSTGVNTFFGQAANLIDQTESVGHLQMVLTQVGNFCLITIIIWVIIELAVQFGGRDNPCDTPQGGESGWCPTLSNILVLIVGGIPVAMPTVLSVTMAIGAMQLAKKDAIVTRLTAIEELAGMEILCSDKTGTLTLNQLSVDKNTLFPVHNYTAEEILINGALSARVENNEPIDVCVHNACADKDSLWTKHTLVHYTPFDPVNKRTIAKVKDNQTGAIFRTAKGAPQVILKMDSRKDELAAAVTAKIDEFANRGYRALGVARSDSGDVPLDQCEWRLVGLIPLFDPPRVDSGETIRRAKAMGVDVKMITGDQLAIAVETARQLGMSCDIHTTAFFNQQLPPGSLSIDELVEAADGFAEVFPEHKYDIVKRLQDRKHIVGMTGDGVNDAPALKKADIGIAVADATDAARSAADIVLLTPGLSVIIDAIIGSRKIFRRMKNYAIYSITMTVRIVFTFGLLTVIYDWYFPTIIIVILAILNDGTVMTIAKDRVKPNENPDAWKLNEIFIVAFALGIWLTLSTIILFEIAYRTSWFYDTFRLTSFQYIDITPNCAGNTWLPSYIKDLQSLYNVVDILKEGDPSDWSYIPVTSGAVYDSNFLAVVRPEYINDTTNFQYITVLWPASNPQSYQAITQYGNINTGIVCANGANTITGAYTCQQMAVCALFERRQEEIRGLIYIQVSVTGQATIFVTRAKRFSYMERPAYILLAAFALAQLIATLIGVYGFNGMGNERQSFRGCGWGYALVAWIWSIIWWIGLDFIKLFTQWALSGGFNRMYNRTTFVASINAGHPSGRHRGVRRKTHATANTKGVNP